MELDMKGIGAGKKTKEQVVKENINVYKDIYVKVEQQARLLDEVGILLLKCININHYYRRLLVAITNLWDPTTSPMNSGTSRSVASVKI